MENYGRPLMCDEEITQGFLPESDVNDEIIRGQVPSLDKNAQADFEPINSELEEIKKIFLASCLKFKLKNGSNLLFDSQINKIWSFIKIYNESFNKEWFVKRLSGFKYQFCDEIAEELLAHIDKSSASQSNINKVPPDSSQALSG